MPFTTICFSQSVNEAGAWTNINAVIDPHVRTEGQFCYISEFNKIIGACGLMDTTPDQVRLGSPSIRRINPYYINEISDDLVWAGDIPDVFHPNAIVPLDVNEGLEAEANGTPGAGQVHSIVVFLANTAIAPVAGNIFTVHFTTTIILVASTWVYAEIALVDDLPVGVYDVVGARLESPDSVVFRFVPVGGVNRPGGIPVASDLMRDCPLQRFGGLGTWFSFNSVQLPGIEAVDHAGAGSKAMDGYFDLIKKG